MSKLSNYRRINPADYPDAPAWFEQLAEALNQTLDELVTTLQGGITSENENVEHVSLSVYHNTYFEFNFPTVRGTPEEVSIVSAAEPVSYFWWYLKREGLIRAFCNFASATASPVDVRIKIRGN